MNMYELILSISLILILVLFIYFIFKGRIDYDEEKHIALSIEYLCEALKNSINEIINMELGGISLNKADLEKRKALKKSLSEAVRSCSQGNLAAKQLVIRRVKTTLSNNFGINQSRIDEVIPFQNESLLKAQDKFEILMYLEKNSGNRNMLRSICDKSSLDKLKYEVEKGYYYSITEEDINKAYNACRKSLSYDDKLNILTQRIYQQTYGLSVVDLMVMEDESIDSVSGGVSGITKCDFRYLEDDLYRGDFPRTQTHQSVWIVLGGKSMHLQFLSFPSKEDMIRICKNLSEHGRIGHLISSEGGLKTHLADGSRVTVFRPNNGSQWAFFVRKFGSAPSYQMKDLIKDKGSIYPIQAIRWATKGCVNMFFSGDQNSGKTTNTRAVIGEMDRRQQIRTVEADFELYLNDAYHDRNILGVRPSERMNFQKVIELLKSSEAHTILFGETAHLEHARHLVDLSLAGTKRVITTGHWTTPEDLVSYFVHSMGGYGTSGAQDIEVLIVRMTHLDIHCVKDNDGHRYIERITEIIPYEREDTEPEGEGLEGKLEVIAHHLRIMNRRKAYYTRNIIVYQDGEYRMENPFSNYLVSKILSNLAPEDKQLFLSFNSLEKEVILTA